MAAQTLWETLTDVEKTALYVSFQRHQGSILADGTVLYDSSFDAKLVRACVPEEVQSQYAHHVGLMNWMAVRTAEIDDQLMRLLSEDSARSQVVILGSGLDTRPWRLAWPRQGALDVYEVDTGSVEGVKLRVLGDTPLSCRRRAFVQADLGQLPAVRAGLEAAGLDTQRPIVWLLEGLVGYLTRSQSYRLFCAMHAMSPPGSAVVMTCPPTHTDRRKSESLGFKLSHSTFEAASASFHRLTLAGWSGGINHARDLQAKWHDIPTRQSQVVAVKGVGSMPHPLAATLYTRCPAWVQQGAASMLVAVNGGTQASCSSQRAPLTARSAPGMVAAVSLAVAVTALLVYARRHSSA